MRPAGQRPQLHELRGQDGGQEGSTQAQGAAAHPDPVGTDVGGTVVRHHIHHVVKLVFEVLLQAREVV